MSSNSRNAPSGPPPADMLDAVEVVTRRKSAPKGPPPSGMMSSNFRAPRSTGGGGGGGGAGPAPSMRRASNSYRDDDEGDDNYSPRPHYQQHRQQAPRESGGSSHSNANSHRAWRSRHSQGDRPDEDDEDPNAQYIDYGGDDIAETGRDSHGDYRSGSSGSQSQLTPPRHNHSSGGSSRDRRELAERGMPMMDGDHRRGGARDGGRSDDARVPAQAEAKDGLTMTTRRLEDPPVAHRPGEILAATIEHYGHTSKCRLFSFSPLLRNTYRELRNFVGQPCAPGLVTRCYIERNRRGTNALAPVYSLCADLEDGTGRELIVCRKVPQARSSYYAFSLKTDDLYRKRENRSRMYLGKLRQRDDGSYVLFDSGGTVLHGTGDDAEEEKLGSSSSSSRNSGNGSGSGGGGDSKRSGAGRRDSDAKDSGDSLYRHELAVIRFNEQKRPVSSPRLRGMEMGIRMIAHGPGGIGGSGGAATADSKHGSDDGVAAVAPPAQVVSLFDAAVSQGRQNELHSDKVAVFHERNSKYDALSACLVDFHSRANIASVKNFQLVYSLPQRGVQPEADGSSRSGCAAAGRGSFLANCDEADRFTLQCGKTAADCFNMDYKYPFSMFQAFAACIARFDANLSFS